MQEEEEEEAVEEVVLKEIRVVNTREPKEEEVEVEENVNLSTALPNPLKGNKMDKFKEQKEQKEEEDVAVSVEVAVVSAVVAVDEAVEKVLPKLILIMLNPSMQARNNPILTIPMNVGNTLTTLDQEEEAVVVVEHVEVDLRVRDKKLLFTTQPFNHPHLPKKVRSQKDLRDLPSTEEDVEEDSLNVILALEDQSLENSNDQVAEEPTGANMVLKLKKVLLKQLKVMRVKLLKSPSKVMTKKRRKNQLLKRLRKLILLSGKDNNKKRRQPYKTNSRNNKRKFENPTMAIAQLSRISSSTREMNNPPNLLLLKKRTPRRRLKKRRQSL